MHSHAWKLINAALRRFRCDCGVIGYARPGRKGVSVYECQQEVNRRDGHRVHCGKPAVHVTALRTQSRCAEHVPVELEVSERLYRRVQGGADMDAAIHAAIDDAEACS